MAESRVDIVELKTNNFTRWRNDVQVALIIAQCSEAVEFDAKPDNFTEDQWMVAQRNAQAIILKALKDDYWRVAQGDTPFQILRTIQDAFQPTSSLITVMKICKFFFLSKGVTGSEDIVKEVTSAFAELQHALRASPNLQNTVVIDPSVRTAVLAFALEKSDPAAAAQIKERFERNAITFEQAVSLLAEIRITHRSAVTGNPSANAVSGENLCSHCNGHHSIERCWFRNPQLAPEKLRGKICTFCKKIGHATRSCPRSQMAATATSSNQDGAASSSQTHFTFGVRHDVFAATTTPSTIIVDSGATIHMMFDKEMFTTYNAGPPPTAIQNVYTASGQPLPVTGYGTVSLDIDNVRTGGRHKFSVTDVLHVPDLKENILSVSTLDRKGVEITTGNQKMIIRSKGQFVASAMLSPTTSQYHLSYLKI